MALSSQLFVIITVSQSAISTAILGCMKQPREEATMELYIVRRYGIWSSEDEIEAANEKSLRVGEEMKDRLRWIRSYAVTEDDGRVGSLCIYEASDPDAIREHGRRIGAPSEDFHVVRGTAIKRSDPQPVMSV